MRTYKYAILQDEALADIVENPLNRHAIERARTAPHPGKTICAVISLALAEQVKYYSKLCRGIKSEGIRQAYQNHITYLKGLQGIIAEQGAGKAHRINIFLEKLGAAAEEE